MKKSDLRSAISSSVDLLIRRSTRLLRGDREAVERYIAAGTKFAKEVDRIVVFGRRGAEYSSAFSDWMTSERELIELGYEPLSFDFFYYANDEIRVDDVKKSRSADATVTHSLIYRDNFFMNETFDVRLSFAKENHASPSDDEDADETCYFVIPSTEKLFSSCNDDGLHDMKK